MVTQNQGLFELVRSKNQRLLRLPGTKTITSWSLPGTKVGACCGLTHRRRMSQRACADVSASKCLHRRRGQQRVSADSQRANVSADAVGDGDEVVGVDVVELGDGVGDGCRRRCRRRRWCRRQRWCRLMIY